MFIVPIDAETHLELLEEHHARELFAVVDANRDYLRRWLPWLDQNTALEHTRTFIRSGLERFAARDGFACGLRHQGDIAGVVGLHFVDWANRRTSVGYWLAEPYQGKGLMTRACAALLDQVFGEMGLNCVELCCAVENRRSCAIPERLGFTREGVLRAREWLYDRFVDHVAYSMLSEDWRRLRPAAPG